MQPGPDRKEKGNIQDQGGRTIRCSCDYLLEANRLIAALQPIVATQKADEESEQLRELPVWLKQYAVKLTTAVM